MKLKRVFQNAKWIILCKIIQSLLQMVVGMLCARYLGPGNYGIIGYATSVTALVLPVMKLGLDGTLVNELVREPESEGEIMGTALIMNVLSSLVCMAAVALFVSAANAGDTTVIVVCVLYSISVFCAALEMIQYWFQYKLLSKYASLTMLLAYVAVSAYRIALLITGKSVYWFALTNPLDYGIIGVSLIALYSRFATQKLSFSAKRAKDLFSRSKYYIFAALMVVVIQNTDHVMLTTMISETENGFYSAAITSATLAQFVYYAIIDSFRPAIFTACKENHEDYEKGVSGLYGIIVYLTTAQSVVFILFAKWIIRILYGENFLPAVPVLQILMCYTIFSLMGSVRNIWILAEEKLKYLWRINLTGAVFNIVFNAILIPFFGACGAAAASLMTQFFTNFILGFIMKPIRQNNHLMIQGLRPGFVFSEAKKLYQIIRKGKERKGGR